MRLPEVEAALKRLTAEGLDRHQANHAICSVLAYQLNSAIRDAKGGDQFDTARYYRELSQLTAEKRYALAETEKPRSRVIRPVGRHLRKPP